MHDLLYGICLASIGIVNIFRKVCAQDIQDVIEAILQLLVVSSRIEEAVERALIVGNVVVKKGNFASLKRSDSSVYCVLKEQST